MYDQYYITLFIYLSIAVLYNVTNWRNNYNTIIAFDTPRFAFQYVYTSDSFVNEFFQRRRAFIIPTAWMICGCIQRTFYCSIDPTFIPPT